ncbi:hypothetical protein BGAL_0104g00140 [Botrytis galanthina]|uniref:Uncharacterized protein n=1 Tax=Botrytis galanthina TaxID=278940 RepID=A0A4S8R2L4_9HELO|nr:hypothetical protein BGAL_0104g00140 [Botrytis galanthina]
MLNLKSYLNLISHQPKTNGPTSDPPNDPNKQTTPTPRRDSPKTRDYSRFQVPTSKFQIPTSVPTSK